MKQAWYPVAVGVGIVAVMTPAILLAMGGGMGGGGFDPVVHSIESRYHVHANKIPFMGLISGIAHIASHGGVGGLHVAEIEHFDEDVDGAELNSIVEQHVGKGWGRMIRETTKGGSEQTLIYTKPQGDRMAMLIVDLDGHEMDVVQVSVDPNHIDDDMSPFHHHHHQYTGGSDNNDHPAKDADTHDSADEGAE
jgi:hypothetical protein